RLPVPAGALADLLALQAGEAVTFPDTDYRREMRLGLWILLLGFGGFLLWAIFAPLDGGVPAPGVVAVESTRKKIDHPAGGVIDKILVREGQTVKEGDDLVVLNETQARAALNATLGQWRTAVAMQARLEAERDGAGAIRFPGELTEAAQHAEVASLMRAQESLFRSRRSALQGELRIISESVRGMDTQLNSLSASKTGREKQVALFNEQLSSFERLKKDGFVSRNYLVEVERQLAEVQTRQSEDLAKIADVGTRLAEYRMRGAQREMEYRREVETQHSEVQRDAATLGERLAAQRDTVERLAIRAPVAGTVVDLAFHTIGGVIKPGDRILDVVPRGDQLIIEAQVSPQYIDRLRPGLPADVHFDAYSNRIQQPVVSGRVEVVSADALTDQRSGNTYYAIRVTVAANEARKLGDLKLQPGMQATVMVKTGEASLMVYLLRPLMRRVTTALTE
ncbi:MAG: HlyD family type I secretion periplasmic adaptor subunit, partial [Rhodocyclaceae bacterium]|nr:HlyD family type I secretion periplasmic adaptor subunit [Rhodocyclaceae bacterium]